MDNAEVGAVRTERGAAGNGVGGTMLRQTGLEFLLGGERRHYVEPGFDCADEAEAIRLRPAARWVVRNGRVVAETEPARSTVHVDGSAQPVTFRRDPQERGGAATPPEMVGAGPSRARSEEGAST